MAKNDKIPRMTRAQITEALETVPLDTVILGTRTESKLSPKQREFARNLALGKSKAQAYREAISDKGTKKTQAANGHKVSLLAEVQQIKQAYEVAIEAAKQRTPAQLREFVIHQLTQHALTEDNPPAQRIQALKLLGQVTEVAAFTERRETTTIRRSEDVRAALLEKLRAVTGSAVEGELVNKDEGAESLLAEIQAGHAANAEENAQSQQDADLPESDPTHQPPPSIASDHLATDLHSVPHKRPLGKTNQESDIDSPDISDGELIGVDVHTSLYIEEIEPIVAEKVPAGDPAPLDIETPPVNGT